MYHSYQLYTRNMGLNYCILGMNNLTGYIHVPVKYEEFWKITSIKSAFLNSVLLVSTFWHLHEMSEFCIVCDQLGANSTCLHQGVDWDSSERKIEQLVSGLVQEVKVNECSGNKC